jgi:hypothetical protein
MARLRVGWSQLRNRLSCRGGLAVFVVRRRKGGAGPIFQHKVARPPARTVRDGWNDAAWGRPRRDVESDVATLYERGYEGGLIFRKKHQLDLAQRSVVAVKLPRRVPAPELQA